MLRTQLSGTSIGTTKNNGATYLSTAHGEHFGSSIKNLVQCEDCKIPCHEFYDRAEPVLGSTDCNSGKPELSNRCINNPFLTKFIQHSLTYFVGAIIFCHLFAHKENSVIAPH